MAAAKRPPIISCSSSVIISRAWCMWLTDDESRHCPLAARSALTKKQPSRHRHCCLQSGTSPAPPAMSNGSRFVFTGIFCLSLRSSCSARRISAGLRYAIMSVLFECFQDRLAGLSCKRATSSSGT